MENARRPVEASGIVRAAALLPLAAALALPAAAAGQATVPGVPATAGTTKAVKVPARPLRATAFAVTPGRIVPGTKPAAVLFRLDGGPGAARTRLALVPARGGRPVAGRAVGRRRTGRVITVRWRVTVPAGRYVARLHAVDDAGARLTRTGSALGRVRVTVRAPRVSRPTAEPAPPPKATPAPETAPVRGGRFPIQGAFSFGGPGARFGAGRPGHIHQGQDVFAAEGTPLISPAAGVVFWRAVQPGGAGHYLVVRTDAGPDYVFMHLMARSERVAKGDRVSAGGPLGRVGHTGRADGSHLHFELWPDGWQAKGSAPVDPLPQLRAWAVGR